ncbi:MAG: uroporphyrinogen-III synthase [Armatimonadota bacterium]|nr:uroporphyrinogen-III synthase [Armatimonadota bacterium]MDR7443849.1 uroporphyrinogen-III synthase [Armatimonadota bacterium]MDR7568983.1 uroporphyrinogen-III synthase [Armatimonadota bacterium]MDR7613872.1 uroporphyrinogen-III synthase [Armatimonadota bacterium]
MTPRVLVLESRMPEILATLGRRAGWEVVCAAAVVEVDADPEEVRTPLERLCQREVDWVVLQTGAGAERLYRIAEHLGLGQPYVEALRTVPVAVRGPKPAAVLQRWGIRPTLAAPSPYTTAELCAALDSVPLAGKTVFVQHYGEGNEPLRAYLLGRGAAVVDAQPYRWALPPDPRPLREAVRGLVEGAFSAVLVTSRPQVTHLFRVAEELGCAEALREALNGRVTVAAVGPVSRQALLDRGVPVSVEPPHPKMKPLIESLREHLRGVGG